MENSQKGFIPVMLTPFSGDGAIDYAALTQLTEVYLKAGATGLFANCLSSEMFELSNDERLKVISHVIEVVDGAVPVVATGTFGGAIPGQADFVKRVNDLGTEAVIMIAGLLAEEQEADEVFDQRVFDLFDQTPGIPMGFYECPVPYKRTLNARQLQKFVESGRVIYHKDTCLDLGQIKEKLEVTAGYPKFGLYDAYMVHAVASLKAGSAGLSCIQGNYFPELIVWLCDHYNDALLAAEVNRVQQFLIDNMDVMHEVYPIVSKYFLQKRGLSISTFTRRDVGTFNNRIVKEVEALFQRYDLLRNDLDIKMLI
ncbi:dihydrodipicolinate synthase family protein [Pedobacter africanus]|uniref:4-hydroxy-tetrahydrodipicolinate synthase n=1 Tax=Pedobacter africanus TaxID=151894 RepID=A0A1W1YUW2_9SPHI|nr:dihydrodipicolinate synthase family protein [Pedobacter africanus]SMC39969.1 4-hydroxy-tetrahydrodipicolinate synthase [Pedobacter africanus]